MTELVAEVCVVGGGPSGAVLARRLAALGHDVCLVERAPSAARRPGESLAPGILPVLDAAGVRDAVEALAPLRARGAIVRWSSPEPAAVDHGAAGLLIDRERFDHALRDEARRAGAAVLCPAIAGRPARAGGGEPGWSVPIRAGDRSLVLRARFLCDATGRPGLLGGPRDAGVPTLALTTHLRAPALEAPVVEAAPDAWLWAAPLPDGTTSVMAFVDPARARRSTAAGRARLLDELLERSALLRRFAAVPDAIARDATTYARRAAIEPDAIRVGEASFAIDPLSSQGVQAAIGSALHAAVVVHTLLVAPDRSSAAMQFYRDRRAEAVLRHAAWAAQLYGDRDPSLTDPFWTRRAATASLAPVPAPAVPPAPLPSPPTGVPLALSPAASLASTPCLEGDLVGLGKALFHPTLDRPLAFLGDTPVAPLLEALAPGDSAHAIVAKWSSHVGGDRDRAYTLLTWLFARGVIECAP